MPTCISDFLEQTRTKWKEVDILISEATKKRDHDAELYQALCRSITVLLVAHFEGFTKELVRAIIADLNSNCEFRAMPESVKRTYCRKYFGNREDGIKYYDRRITLLKETFEEHNCKITHEPFFYPDNKNPNPKTIKDVFSNFGIKNVFAWLHNSELENPFFAESNSVLTKVSRKFTNMVKKGVAAFPYSCNTKDYGLEHRNTKRKTLWEEFIENINQRRHDVAHGNNLLNTEDVVVLKECKDKVVLLETALVAIICVYITEHSDRDTKH